MRFLTC